MIVPRTGRPLKGDAPRSEVVAVRFTPAEFEWLRRQMSATRGMTMAEVIRSLALAGMPRPGGERSPAIAEKTS